MASFGNEMERTHRQGGRSGEVVEPVMSPGNDDHPVPVKMIGSTDRALQPPRRADSAYSSSSGGSECPTRPCCGECCRLPYMDSEYVQGIYNLSAAPPELRPLQPPRAAGLSTPLSSPSPNHCGITPTPATSNQGPPSLAAPPPSPPARLHSITRHHERSGAGHSSGGHSGCKVQPAPGVQDNQLAHRDAPGTQHRDGLTERDPRPAREKTLENKGLPPDSTDEVFISNIQGLKTGGNGEWSPPQQPTKRSNPHIFSRPSSFIFQEYLKTDSVANVPKILSAYNSVHAYKIPNERTSKSHHPAHSKPNAVNDPQEVKQCPCGVQEPTAREVTVPSTVPGPSQRKGPLPCAQDLLCAQGHPDLDQDVFEDSCDLKHMENALLIKNTSRKLDSCTDKDQCYDSEGKIGRGVREPVLNQQARVQRSAVSCSCEAVPAEHPQLEGLDQGREQCCDTNRAFFTPKKDSTSHSGCESQEGKQANNSNPDLSTCLEQGDPPVQKHQPEFQTKLSRQLWEDCAGEQITRQMTPMLYYLSGWKPSNVPHPSQLPPSQEDSRRSLKAVPSSGCAVSAQPVEVQRESPQCQGLSHHHRDSADLLLQCQGLSQHHRDSADLLLQSQGLSHHHRDSADLLLQCQGLSHHHRDSADLLLQSQGLSHHHRDSADLLLLSQDLTPGSPASFTEESFKNDYREKLKVAQKKVLRETSFQRKDLQMSLPVRLRQKPSKRPSIEHLRSFSLSSANEDAKPALCSPSHLQSLESFKKDGEIQKPQTGRVGGRKRVTREEKNLCFSEPEKLDQLMDKEVSWSQVRDEITEQDIVAGRRRGLENGGRALSSSSISRTELKQIQHTALMEYVERKISQRPGGSQQLPLHQPPLQKRLAHPRGPPGKISNPSGSSKMHNDDVFHQVFSREKSPDVSPALAFAAVPSVSSRGDPSRAHGSSTSNCPAAERLPQAGDPASGGAPDRSQSTPPSPQDTCRCASGAAAPSQSCQGCASSPSFCDPEKDGSKNRGHNDRTGHACFQDPEELTPETSVPIPSSGSEEGAGVEEECRSQSPGGNAALKPPEQHPAASLEQHPAASPEQHPAAFSEQHPAAFPEQHPAASLEQHPAASLEQHPAASLEQHPAASPEQHPAAFPEQHPAASLEQHPAASLEQHPAASPEQHPAAFPEQHPAASPEQHPAASPEQHPAASLEQHPAASPEQHPAAFPEQHPAAFPEQHPAAFPEQHPAAFPEQHPAAFPEQHPAASPEQGRSPQPALAQPLQGDRDAAPGLIAQEDAALGRGTHLPRRRLRSPHDQRHRELVLEIVAKDRSLVDILLPHPDRKTALDLMEGLFPVNISMLDKSPREKGSVQHVQENEKSHGDGPEECPESEHEAKPWSKESTSEGHQVLTRSRDCTNDPDDITSKKLELMGSLRARLQSLWQERELVLQESRECAQRGRALEATVRDLCKPNEFQRYLMFIGDLEKVVSLLLCLSSRLARVQNAMSRMDGSTDTEEKHSLSERLELLSRQREDAKDLKDNLDRRERVVSGILAKYLTEQQLQDYRHFVQVKTSLLIEQKDLEEQMKFFKEQLETLEQSLPP